MKQKYEPGPDKLNDEYMTYEPYLEEVDGESIIQVGCPIGCPMQMYL